MNGYQWSATCGFCARHWICSDASLSLLVLAGSQHENKCFSVAHPELYRGIAMVAFETAEGTAVSGRNIEINDIF